MPLGVYGLLRREPLSRGAHLGTTAVLWGGRGIGGMRVPDEHVRHRALDAIGDLPLVGHPMLAKVTARHTGYDPDAATAAKVMAELDACMIDPV